MKGYKPSDFNAKGRGLVVSGAIREQVRKYPGADPLWWLGTFIVAEDEEARRRDAKFNRWAKEYLDSIDGSDDEV